MAWHNMNALGPRDEYGKAAKLGRGLHKANSAAGRGVWKGLASLPGGYAAGAVVFGAMSYDSSKHEAGHFMAAEGMRTAGDFMMDAALFGVMGLWSMPVSMGMHMTGMSPGSGLAKLTEEADRRAGGPTITQNERTRGAMQQSLNMLRQSSTANRVSTGLGNEATIFHN